MHACVTGSCLPTASSSICLLPWCFTARKTERISWEWNSSISCVEQLAQWLKLTSISPSEQPCVGGIVFFPHAVHLSVWPMVTMTTSNWPCESERRRDIPLLSTAYSTASDWSLINTEEVIGSHTLCQVEHFINQWNQSYDDWQDFVRSSVVVISGRPRCNWLFVEGQ